MYYHILTVELTIILQMLLNSDLPFRLGGKTFQLLLDNFLCHDFSIQKFLHCMGLLISFYVQSIISY